MSEEVVLGRLDGVLRLTLHRPEALNALTSEMLSVLLGALEAAVGDSTIRSILIDGAGDKGFCSGIDLARRGALSLEAKGAQSRQVLAVVKAVLAAPQPVVVALHGHCLGAGLELALGCDVRLAAEDVRIGFPEISLGAYPGGGGAVLLPRLLGRAKAIEWLMSNRRIDAGEAFSAGLVSRVVPGPRLHEEALATARHLASLAPLAVRALKASISASLDLPLGKAFEIDQGFRRPLDDSRDYQEALAAFKEKRAPVFTGQ